MRGATMTARNRTFACDRMLEPVTTAARLNPVLAGRHAIVALMVGLSAMSYFDRTIMSIAGPGIMRELHFSETQMGSVYSAFLLTYAIMMGPGGVLADRLGPRWILTLSGIGNAILTGLTGVCSRLGGFHAIRLTMGFISAPLYPACGVLSANWIPPVQTARVQALIMSGSALGGAISPIAFAPMIGRFGWRTSFWLAALATAALYAVWHWYVRDYPPGTQPSDVVRRKRSRQPWIQLLRQRNLVLLTLSYFCLNYFEYIFFYWIYYYFGEIRHMGARQSAMYVTILMLTTVVMTPLGGWVSDRLVLRYGLSRGRRLVPLAGMALSAVLLYAGASGLGTFATVALLSLAFGFSESVEGPFWASAIDIGGGEVGAACGIMNSGGNFGGILAPTLTPILASHFGWTAGLYFGSAVVVVGMAAWFFLDLSRK
jgi:MFS family permease